ncbi:MAG: beta-ketoacyl-[acyl-carrier-protein] synthase family protein [Verrucomicrobiota bacterium]
MSPRYPVVTGLGIITAAGLGLKENWQAIADGTCGLRPLSLFESPRYGPVPVGEIQLDLVRLGAPANSSRSDKLAWLAAREAIHDADIRFDSQPDRAGVLLGCSVGGSFGSENFLQTLLKRGKMRPGCTRHHTCVSSADLIADHFGLLGPSLAVATACSSGALAIAMAGEMILSGEADVMLAGGADSLSRMTWGGFHSLLLVDSAGCRPFDASRGGMSLGEGAAVLVIEAEESARRRGATILARLTGWGASCDAHHATAPHPEGAGALTAMRTALRRAQLDPSAIRYVNAHGTGTRDNDLAEGKALKSLFGENVPPFSSTKRYFGHALAASGAIEAVICVEALRRQQLPPSLGFSAADPNIGLSPVTEMQSAPLTHVMSNSFGFGGNNAVLVLSQPEATARTTAGTTGPVAVTGLGVVGPGPAVVRDIPAPLAPGKVLVHECGPVADTALLSPNQRRRLNRMTQLSLVAARRSHSADPAMRTAIVLGSGFGCLEEGSLFIENLIAKDEREPMPARFPGSVHNAVAGQIAIDQNAHGLNSAPTAGEISFECALWQAMNQLHTGEADTALAGAMDELNKYVLAIGQRWKIWNDRIIPGEGVTIARLSPLNTAASPLARVSAVKLGRYRRPFDARREADWIAAAVDLQAVDVFLSGANGLVGFDEHYHAVAAELCRRAGRNVEHQTYKQTCGEFYSASAFGFSVAVERVKAGSRGVLLYTLAARGAKALCLVQPASPA